MEETLDEQVGQMVGAWLNRKYDYEVFGEPTWRKLAIAVAARSGGCHQRLASEIARDHPLCYTSKCVCRRRPQHLSTRDKLGTSLSTRDKH